MQHSNGYLPLPGRALIALPSIFSGVGKLAAYMILGGLLQIVYFGAGPSSLDARATPHKGEGTLGRQPT